MYLKMKQNFVIQMLAISSYLMSAVKAEEWIVDINSSQFKSVVRDIAQLQRENKVKIGSDLREIDDLVILCDVTTKNSISAMDGVNLVTESKMGDFSVLGWSDPVQPEETRAGRKLAEEVPYGIKMVNADPATGGLAPGSTPIKVCVVDTGYDNTGQEDNPAAVGGFSPYGGTEYWYADGHGHGTHCAGTIGAIGNNDKGVIGVVGDPTIDPFFIGKGLTNSGSGSGAGVMESVEECVKAGAKVISMSLGGGGYSSTSNAQYKQHYEVDNVLIIAAAGNGGSSSKSYPASYPAVMSVAAVDSNKNKAGFSQYNDQVEIAAPGVGVKSTLPGNQYASWSGTSMATPHVAGVAALVWSHFPECSAQDIRFAIDFSAQDVGDDGCDINYGYGIVDALGAYNHIKENGCSPIGTLPTPTDGGCTVVPEGPTPAPEPTAAPTPCPATDALFSIQIDNYGGETDWEIKKSGIVVAQGGNYASNSLTQVPLCLQDGDYNFKIVDTFGDGICCSYGTGFYKLQVGNEVLVEGGQFGSSATHDFSIGSNSCKDWCGDIIIPFKSDNPSDTQKCNFTGHCDKCPECN